MSDRKSPNYNFNLYAESDTIKNFIDYRTDIAGDGATANFMIIDTILKQHEGLIEVAKNSAGIDSGLAVFSTANSDSETDRYDITLDTTYEYRMNKSLLLKTLIPNTKKVEIRVNNLPYKPVWKPNTIGSTIYQELSANNFERLGVYILTYDGSQWQLMISQHPSINKDVNIYWSKIGSDITGDGTVANPYLTLEKCISVLPKEINGNVYIYNNDALQPSYPNSVLILDGFHGVGSLTIRGGYFGKMTLQNCQLLILFNGMQLAWTGSFGSSVISVYNCKNVQFLSITYDGTNHIPEYGNCFRVRNCQYVSFESITIKEYDAVDLENNAFFRLDTSVIRMRSITASNSNNIILNGSSLIYFTQDGMISNTKSFIVPQQYGQLRNGQWNVEPRLAYNKDHAFSGEFNHDGKAIYNAYFTFVPTTANQTFQTGISGITDIWIDRGNSYIKTNTNSVVGMSYDTTAWGGSAMETRLSLPTCALVTYGIPINSKINCLVRYTEGATVDPSDIVYTENGSLVSASSLTTSYGGGTVAFNADAIQLTRTSGAVTYWTLGLQDLTNISTLKITVAAPTIATQVYLAVSDSNQDIELANVVQMVATTSGQVEISLDVSGITGSHYINYASQTGNGVIDIYRTWGVL